MAIKLNDIIDLDYFIRMDDALDSEEKIQARTVKDRNLYDQCRSKGLDERALLMEWLAFRKQEFFKNRGKKGVPLLPGTIFCVLYSWINYAMVLSGSVLGISLAYSFLAYHGNRPINVTVFIAFFVILPLLLMGFSLVVVMKKYLFNKKTEDFFHQSIVHTVILFLLFDLLPRLLKKTGWSIFKTHLDNLEYTAALVRVKSREYNDLFFWPVFITASLFALSFSTGALGGTFFRVVVSDMAFGWQSTLMASAERVHGLVSFIALPWSWFIPPSLAHPSLEQIEGSRIILKEGLSVLATQDLVSWWPFICMGMVSYAVIPRGIFIIAGILAQNRVLLGFNFNRPRFRQLIVRMQSSVLDIDTDKTGGDKASESGRLTDTAEKLSVDSGPMLSGQHALLLVSKTVYADKTIQHIIAGIQTHLFFHVKQTMGISFDLDNDVGLMRNMDQNGVDQVILVHEVWQPPIRGVLYYITQIKRVMPPGMPLWILLTSEAGQDDLSVERTDVQYDVWKKAVFKLENPDIAVKRFVSS